MTDEAEDGPWQAGAIGRIPEDDSLVWRDDAVHGPQFYAATPGDAEKAARLMNALEKRVVTLHAVLLAADMTEYETAMNECAVCDQMLVTCNFDRECHGYYIRKAVAAAKAAEGAR